MLLASAAGWFNRNQADVIAYLLEDYCVLRKQLGKRRLRLVDDQRRRLAAKGVTLGRAMQAPVATIVTPDPILR